MAGRIEMKSWKTKSGVEIFQVLKNRSNSYLIVSENGNVLIDTGRRSAFLKLRKNIDELKLPQKEIDLLILTHTHYDHCQNASALQKLYGCRTVVSESEAKFAENGYTPLPNGTFLMTRLISRLGTLIGRRRYGYQPFIPDIKIAGNLDLEKFNIRIISTPGHSSGSISVVVEDEIAIVGDTLFGAFRNSVFPPFADDVEEMVKSWGRLLKTNCYTFLPGHRNEIKRELLKDEFESYHLSVLI